MKFRVRLSAFAVLLTCTAAATAAVDPKLASDAQAFGAREIVEDVAISPSGSKALMLSAGPGSVTYLQVADLNTGIVKTLTNSDGRKDKLYWCQFAGDDNIVCAFGGVQPYNNLLTRYEKLVALRADGSAFRALGQQAKATDSYLRQTDGDVIDWLPDQDGTILMSRLYIPENESTGTIISRTKDGLGVDRVDLKSFKSSMVEPPKSGVGSYMTDGRGHVRLLEAARTRGEQQDLTGKVLFKFRVAGSNDWRDFGTYDITNDEGYLPLAVEAGSDSLFALRKTNGRMALYRVKLDGSGAASLVGSNDAVDIDDVVRLGPGQRVIGYTFADDRRQTVYFDPELASLRDALARATNQPMISFHGASADGQKVIVLAGSDTNAGTFYRFDRATKQLAEISAVRPALTNRTLSPMVPIRIPASDGVQIPAYLTIPAGTSGKNLPAVVLPHGGPSARDEWGFDWLAQFLAARGYVVVQPNFRGSSGYGDQWLEENGFKSWRTSIGDVNAAAKYLVDQGIADPKRLAILGWSYGGYAALQSAAMQPQLYKATIAIAPVTDLSMFRQEASGFTNYKLVKDYVGSGPHLTEGSPLRNADKIAVPVLLVHGDLDTNVSIHQSERMENALRAAGKQVEFLKFDGLDHQLDDSSARTEMLTKVGELLDRTIGH